MKSFKEMMEEVEKSTGDLKKACWKGYTAVGMKMKNGRKVPNCVPEEVELDEDKAQYRYTGGMHGEYHPTKKQPSRAAHKDAAKFHERESKTYSKALGEKGADKDYVNRAIDFHTNAASHHRNMASSMKEEVEQIDEMQGDDYNQGGWNHDPYDYNKGKWTQVKKILTNKEAAKSASKIANRIAKQIVKKKVKEEVEHLDEISKDMATRYMKQIERQPGLDKDHPDKRNYRAKQQSIGYERAFNKVSPYGKRVKVKATESVEQIDELSKDTLKSYVKKAVPDMQNSQKRAEGSLAKSNSELDKGNESKAKKHYSDAEAAHERTQKRMAGIAGAIRRVKANEEVEQIDEAPAWQRKEGKNPEGGLNQKGVDSYRRENPGSKLQTAVTTEPSKLKKGSKAANRRLSFCRRMKGMKDKLTSAETARDPDSRINKSLRKWNC